MIAGQPKGRVHEQGRGLADEELGVGRLLADSDAEFAVEELLVEPQRVEAGGWQRLDHAGGQQVADIVARQAGAVDEVGVGVHGGAVPAGEPLQVEIEPQVQPVLDDRPLANAADGIAERFGDVGEAVLDAPLLQQGPQAERVTEGPERGLDRAHVTAGRLARRFRLGHRDPRVAARALIDRPSGGLRQCGRSGEGRQGERDRNGAWNGAAGH
ncbi:UNVERIFIED_ORG: hypothetical protein M2438_005075 [Methylobacterium sp. SuP10 SLI 274]|nr:hypothetical protein [Methylobacterium sp. SuP10 SLI 274]